MAERNMSFEMKCLAYIWSLIQCSYNSHDDWIRIDVLRAFIISLYLFRTSELTSRTSEWRSRICSSFRRAESESSQRVSACTSFTGSSCTVISPYISSRIVNRRLKLYLRRSLSSTWTRFLGIWRNSLSIAFACTTSDTAGCGDAGEIETPWCSWAF